MSTSRGFGQKTADSVPGFAVYLPERVRHSLSMVDQIILDALLEVRLRLYRPVILVLDDGERLLGHRGLCRAGEEAICFTHEMRDEALQLLTDRSMYAAEEQLRSGYLTIAGGHRVGVVGRAVTHGGTVESIADVSSINLRVARDAKGCSAEVLPRLLGGPLGVYRSLIFSPPGCGKTTMLRDLAKRLSDGIGSGKPFRVAIVDERSELAGCYCGVPQRDVGVRTDVLDRVPKAVGIMMVIRSMAPQVIVTDELGRSEDVDAVEECLNAGVALLASAHAGSVEELTRRPALAAMLSRGLFDRYVRLSDRPRVGTVAEILKADEVAEMMSSGHLREAARMTSSARPREAAGMASSGHPCKEGVV